MKSFTEYLTFNTAQRIEIINITDRIADIARKSGIQDGLVLVSAMHITAAVFVNDEEEGLKSDILEFLERLAPVKGHYRHHQTGEDNGYAHIWNLLMGHQVIIPVSPGREPRTAASPDVRVGTLDLGPWQQVFYGEFDGQRNKRVLIKLLGE